MNQTLSLKNLIWSGLSLLIALAVLSFIIYPSILNIVDTNQKIDYEKSSLESKLANQMSVNKVKKDLIDVQVSVNKLDQVFIKPGKELEFISSIENLATQNKVTVDIKSDFNYPKGQGLKSIPLQITAEGSYDNLINFIKDLESLPYYYDFNTISIINGSNLTLVGQIYLQ